MEQRAYNIRSLLVFGLLLTWPTLAAATPCYDVSRGQPAGLTGTLDYVVLAGPPHYENVQKGNTSEPSFVLRLAHPICVQGSKSADPKTSLQAVQLVKTAKVQGKLKPLLHRQITVTLKNPAPETVHPQAPLFAWVTGVAPATPQVESTKERVPALTTHQVEVAKVDRTAATPHQMKVAKAHEPAAAPHQMKVAKAGTAASTHQVALTEERVAVPTAHRMKVAKARGTAATTHQTKVAKAHGTAATTHQVALTEERVPVPTTHQMKIAKAHGTAATTHRMKFAKGSGTAATTHQGDLAEEHDTAGTTHQVEFTDDQEPDDIADQMEIAEEHGSGAKTVRAFYTRLGDGRGDIASAMVVPRKRAHGPFSADELSRFYGHLQHPIRLEDVETNGPGEFLVHYRYAGSTWGCNGRALVKTVARSGRSYIKSINALDGC